MEIVTKNAVSKSENTSLKKFNALYHSGSQLKIRCDVNWKIKDACMRGLEYNACQEWVNAYENAWESVDN